jgi:hypothetical protein
LRDTHVLENLFRWLGATPVGLYMRDSDWGFASVETVHLLGLTALGGVVVVANLAGAGVILRQSSPAAVQRGLRGFGAGALVALVVSGVLLVSSKPIRYYLDGTFRIKMLLLALAIASSIALYRAFSASAETPSPALRGAALISLALWLSVGVAGRIIGFL